LTKWRYFISEYYRFLPFKWSFNKSDCLDLIANDELLLVPIHPTSIHWIIRSGGNAGVCNRSQQAAQLSQRDRAAPAGWDSFGGKWKTVYVYLRPLWRNRPARLSNLVK